MYIINQDSDIGYLVVDNDKSGFRVSEHTRAILDNSNSNYVSDTSLQINKVPFILNKSKFIETPMKININEVTNIAFTNLMGSKLFASLVVSKIHQKSRDIARGTHHYNSNKLNIAEIWVKYGSTARLVLENEFIKSHVGIYDGYELDQEYARIARSRVSDINIIIGNATNTLETTSNLYDIVYFDASHHYVTDMSIIRKLINHLEYNSMIVFDDTNLGEVRKVVKDTMILLISKRRFDVQIIN